MGSKKREQTFYEKGVAVEREVANIFKDAGWICTRAAKSGGPWDLVATKQTWKNNKVVWVVALMQVKVKKR